jgi:hypothetical protein
MKTLHLLPYGGLCNRLNAMASCVNLIQDKNITLNIYWDNNNDLAADIDDLFIISNVKEVKYIKLRWYHVLYFRSRKTNLFIPTLLRLIMNVNQITDWSTSKGPMLPELKGKNNYVSTCHSVGQNINISYFLSLHTKILGILNDIIKQFGDHVIGVHIRRGDHQRAIDASPLDSFINKMDKAIEENKKIKFYLATDSLDIKTLLNNKYGNKIITNETILERNSLNGMVGAVVDLWALGRTQKIIGSKFSMFSQVASEINKIPLDLD